MSAVILKPGKEKAIRNWHHWIFSGAIASSPKVMNGEIYPVYSSTKELLGSAYFNSHSSITGRMVSFDQAPAQQAIEQSLENAISLRKELFKDSDTTAYRLVNGEGDKLPGLVVDQYDTILVIQIATLGMEKMKPWLLDFLINRLKPKAIYEKSLLPSRKEEGLKPYSEWLYGSPTEEIVVLENGHKFSVSVTEGQKTGFFIDHREMRQLVKQYAANKRVLNCFSYTGAFSVYALAGGAEFVDSVDISKEAIATAEKNVVLNSFGKDKAGFISDDVFQFLREKPLDYQLVIIDPPAFAKRQKDVVAACRGYKDLNRIAMQKMPAGSFLLTSSCSYHVDANLFQKVIFQAARESGREVKILGQHRMAPDHPINIYHPEGDYLKSLFLYIM